MSADNKVDDSREDGLPSGNERSSSATSTSQRRGDYKDRSEAPLEWEIESSMPFIDERRSLIGFAKERNLHLKVAGVPTDSDYESDASDVSFPSTPSMTPGRKERWKAFKVSNLFSRFQRQTTMPNPIRTPGSSFRESFRWQDDLVTRESKTFMVPYDSKNPTAAPKNVISIRGLIKLCGRDTAGRPIVVIDASYCPPAYMRFVALGHIREKMEAVVEAGEYNLVFVMSPNASKGDANKEVPTMWCLDVYRKLPYAYKKNVQRVVFIHPTFMVNLVLGLLRPFLSSKAHGKIIRVHHLTELEKASKGEITLDQLYLAAHVYLHDKALEAAENPTIEFSTAVNS